MHVAIQLSFLDSFFLGGGGVCLFFPLVDPCQRYETLDTKFLGTLCDSIQLLSSPSGCYRFQGASRTILNCQPSVHQADDVTLTLLDG